MIGWDSLSNHEHALMEQAEFEQAVLRIAHHGGVERLTPQAVAYQLRMEVRDAERMLDRMVTTAQLELDSDDDGNLFYFVPGLGTPGVFTAGTSAANPVEPPQAPPMGPPAGYPTTPYGAPPAFGQPSPYGAGPTTGAPNTGPPPYGAYAPPTGSNAAGGTPYGSFPGAYGANTGSAVPPGPPPAANAGASTGQPGPGQYGGGPYGQPWGQQYNAANQGWAGGRHGQWGPHGQSPGAPPYAYGQNALVPTSGSAAGHSPGTAALLGLIPGAGQLYNGQVGKGLTVFFVTSLLAGIPPLALIPWLWGIVDAHSTAKRQNAQQHYGLLGP